MFLLMILFVGLGLLLALLALPMIGRKLPPNPWYGVRVRATLNDPALWYEVNAYAGRWLFWSGLATALAAIVLFACAALGLLPGGNDAYSLLCLLISVGVTSLGLIRSFAYLSNLQKARQDGR